MFVQIYLVMAQQGSSGESGETSGELKKKAEECLDLALSRLTATDKDVSMCPSPNFHLSP